MLSEGFRCRQRCSLPCCGGGRTAFLYLSETPFSSGSKGKALAFHPYRLRKKEIPLADFRQRPKCKRTLTKGPLCVTATSACHRAPMYRWGANKSEQQAPTGAGRLQSKGPTEPETHSQTCKASGVGKPVHQSTAQPRTATAAVVQSQEREMHRNEREARDLPTHHHGLSTSEVAAPVLTAEGALELEILPTQTGLILRNLKNVQYSRRQTENIKGLYGKAGK